MIRHDFDVLVIGAGVSGLTTAVCLAESGKRVLIWTADPTEATTSMAAGALWGPYLVEPIDRVAVWSQHTMDVFRTLAEQPEAGVQLVAGIEASRTPTGPPDWADRLDDFQLCDVDDLPDGFVTGWRFSAPLIDMPTYLAYLQRRFADSGGVVQTKRVGTLSELTAPLIVNCTGIGARDLVPDSQVTAVRGQLVVVRNPGLTEFFSEDTGPSPDILHYYPQGQTVVLGGQAAHGEWSMEPDLDLAHAIIDRCVEVEPRLRDAPIIEHRVGLRPTRPQVRVEAEQTANGVIVHNYGHGGAGVTLSWGCAADVATLASAT